MFIKNNKRRFEFLASCQLFPKRIYFLIRHFLIFCFATTGFCYCFFCETIHHINATIYTFPVKAINPLYSWRRQKFRPINQSVAVKFHFAVSRYTSCCLSRQIRTVSSTQILFQEYGTWHTENQALSNNPVNNDNFLWINLTPFLSRKSVFVFVEKWGAASADFYFVGA